MSDLIVITYGTTQTGFEALETVERMQRLQLLRLVDAAVVVKDGQGKAKIMQTLEHRKTGTAAAWGGFWGLLLGLLFLGPIFWGIIGALLGALIGKHQDLGIDNTFIKEVGDSLEPGNSCLCMLLMEKASETVIAELSELGGAVFQTSLSEEDEQKLRRALEHDGVREAAADGLALEEG